MKFLTPEYVKIEAEKGEIPALECSWEHHHQGETADWVELRDAMDENDFCVDATHCACCLWAQNRTTGTRSEDYCPTCPLFIAPFDGSDSSHCCGGKWRKLADIDDKLSDDYSNANFKTFQEAEGKLCTYIEGVLEKKRAEKSKSDKEKCGHCQTCRHFTNAAYCENTDKKIKNCSGWQPKESKPALIYAIGDRFMFEGKKLILADTCWSGEVVAIQLSTGGALNSPVRIANKNTQPAEVRITAEQMNDIIRGFHRATRYWDSRKQGKKQENE